ncbi:MAG: hypothetical protein H6Q74_1335 [Firmicutes bacterium]|nr:hypothetical protein [Bacillota bacterium]
MDWLVYLIVLIIVIAVAIWLYVARQGDVEVEFLVEQRTEFTLTNINANTAVFNCKVPFVNKGNQDGTIMDCYTRHLLPQEQFDAVELSSWLATEARPRTDGYFEALIVPLNTGETVDVTMKFTAKNGDIRAAMADMVDYTVDIVYQVVGRGELYITKNRMTVTADELIKSLNSSTAKA